MHRGNQSDEEASVEVGWWVRTVCHRRAVILQHIDLVERGLVLPRLIEVHHRGIGNMSFHRHDDESRC